MLRSVIGFLLIALVCGPARAQTPHSDFDFMLGRWTGRESCKTGVYDVTFVASRCVSPQGNACEDAYSGSATTVARSPGSHGGSGTGTGDPTASPADIAVHIQMPFATLEGAAHFSKALQTGRFGSTGAKMGVVVIPVPFGLQGTFTVSHKGKQLGFMVDIKGPEGPDHCGGTLTKQKEK